MICVQCCTCAHLSDVCRHVPCCIVTCKDPVIVRCTLESALIYYRYTILVMWSQHFICSSLFESSILSIRLLCLPPKNKHSAILRGVPSVIIENDFLLRFKKNTFNVHCAVDYNFDIFKIVQLEVRACH